VFFHYSFFSFNLSPAGIGRNFGVAKERERERERERISSLFVRFYWLWPGFVDFTLMSKTFIVGRASANILLPHSAGGTSVY